MSYSVYKIEKNISKGGNVTIGFRSNKEYNSVMFWEKKYTMIQITKIQGGRGVVVNTLDWHL